MAPAMIQGKPEGRGKRIAVVVSRFNDLIGRRLLTGALDTFKERGVPEENIETAWVPGAWELGVVCAKLARTGRFNGVVALGAIIRGKRPTTRFWGVKSPRTWGPCPGRRGCRSLWGPHHRKSGPGFGPGRGTKG